MTASYINMGPIRNNDIFETLTGNCMIISMDTAEFSGGGIMH